MKLTDEQYNSLISLLELAPLSSDEEFALLEDTAPGVFNSKNYVNGTFKLTSYSLNNPKLKEFFSSLTNQNPDKIVTMHRSRYSEGSRTKPHLDKSTYTLVIILDADLREGGEFYLRGRYMPEFKEKKDYLTYNGGGELHEVREIKKGFREVMVVWWYDKTPTSLI